MDWTLYIGMSSQPISFWTLTRTSKKKGNFLTLSSWQISEFAMLLRAKWQARNSSTCLVFPLGNKKQKGKGRTLLTNPKIKVRSSWGISADGNEQARRRRQRNEKIGHLRLRNDTMGAHNKEDSLGRDEQGGDPKEGLAGRKTLFPFLLSSSTTRQCWYQEWCCWWW